MSTNNKKWCAIGGLLIIFPYIFWYYLGTDSFLLIHDNLDSEFVYIKHILENSSFFNFGFSDKVSTVMNGLPRAFFRSPLNFTVLLFAIFPPVVAYITNHLFVHLIGYLGMFLFLNKVIRVENTLVLLVVSISFGMVSYYHIQYGISISGQPLLIYAFYHILNKKDKLLHWLIITLFPFFSFAAATIPFFVPVLVLLAILDYIRYKRFSIKYILSIALLVIVNLLVEYQLFYVTFIESNIVSHRVEFDNIAFLGKPDWDYFVRTLKTYFKQTQYHSGTLKTWPLIALFGIVLLLFRFKIKLQILLIVSVIILINVWVAANLRFINFFSEIDFLRTFNSERFYFMLPFLWLSLGGMLLKELFSKGKIPGYLGILGILIVFSGIIKNNQEFQTNLSILKGEEIQQPTFKEFYAEDLFMKIKEDIQPYQPNTEYFLSIGMHPSIAQYNNLSTLDSYQNNYDLEYKKIFRKLILEELSKNKGNMKYFDSWGSRCYYFSAEIGRRYIVQKSAPYTIKNMALDTLLFKEMKGRYLISSVPIENSSEIDFDFIKTYQSDTSFWKLYLYKFRL